MPSTAASVRVIRPASCRPVGEFLVRRLRAEADWEGEFAAGQLAGLDGDQLFALDRLVPGSELLPVHRERR